MTAPVATLDPASRVGYLVAGEPADPATPDLVLLHGTGGSAATDWTHLLELFGAGSGRRVIAVDYSGSGATEDDGAPLTLPGLAAQVRAAIAAAGDRPFDLLGFSLGACVAAQLTGTDPHGLRRLMLLAGWAESASDARVALQFGLWEHLHEADVRALAELLALTGFSPGYLAARPPKAIEQALRRTIATLAPGFARQCDLDRRVDLREVLPAITVPTLVISAAEDQMVPAHHAVALAAAIPGARTATVPGGHLALYESPRELAALVTGFLDE